MASAEHAGDGLNIDPMHQFEIKRLVNIDLGFVDLSFTNSALFTFIAVALTVVFLWMSVSGHSLVPSRMQSMAESLYEFVRNMVRDTAGDEALKYFPYIFTLFVFILACNLLGMIPYSFTVTSHFAVTVFLALAVFITVTVIGFMKHGMHFLSFFWPSDAPAVMRPFLCLIEIISYFVRPVSHSIRLGAQHDGRTRGAEGAGRFRWRDGGFRLFADPRHHGDDPARICGCDSASLRVCDPDLRLSQ